MLLVFPTRDVRIVDALVGEGDHAVLDFIGETGSTLWNVSSDLGSPATCFGGRFGIVNEIFLI